MKELFAKALLAYVEMLEIHIDTKTGNEPFHRKTEGFYELLFDVAHEVGERYVDLGEQLRTDSGDCMAQANRVVELLTTVKQELEAFKAPTKGTDNMILNLIDKLEFAIGSATGFIKKDKESKSDAMVVEVSTAKPQVQTNDNGTLTDEVEQIVM